MRKCRNWQTSKTKDLVVAIPCGFKSHLPQWLKKMILDHNECNGFNSEYLLLNEEGERLHEFSVNNVLRRLNRQIDTMQSKASVLLSHETVE